MAETDIPRKESTSVEFKESWSRTVQKTVIAFANTIGGDIWFGVRDNGTAAGLSQEEIDQIGRSVLSFARNGCHPPVDALISERLTESGGKRLLVIHVEAGDQRPYSLSAEDISERNVFVRIGAASVGATREELVSMIRESNPEPWENRVAYQQGLSFESAGRIFAESGLAFGPQFYRVLHISDEEGRFTNLAFILSDQNVFLTNIGFFDASGRLKEMRSRAGSILEQMLGIRRLLDELNVPVMEKPTVGQARKERFRFPPLALREALTNSLAHRDYSASVDASINVFPERIEFVTYGGLPAGLTPEDALSLGTSALRNPRLAEIFSRLGWMEHYGTGFPDIWSSYRGTGREPVLEALPKTLKLVLPALPASDSVPGTDPLGKLPRGRLFTRKDAENLLGLSQGQANRVLAKLLEEGRIARVGSGRNTSYRVLS